MVPALKVTEMFWLIPSVVTEAPFVMVKVQSVGSWMFYLSLWRNVLLMMEIDAPVSAIVSALSPLIEQST